MFIQESILYTTRSLGSNHIFGKIVSDLEQVNYIIFEFEFFYFFFRWNNLKKLYYHKYYLVHKYLNALFSANNYYICYYNKPVILFCAMDPRNRVLCIFPQKPTLKISDLIVEYILCQVVARYLLCHWYRILNFLSIFWYTDWFFSNLVCILHSYLCMQYASDSKKTVII